MAYGMANGINYCVQIDPPCCAFQLATLKTHAQVSLVLRQHVRIARLENPGKLRWNIEQVDSKIVAEAGNSGSHVCSVRVARQHNLSRCERVSKASMQQSHDHQHGLLGHPTCGLAQQIDIPGHLVFQAIVVPCAQHVLVENQNLR
jgi:hypothetical protein